MQRYAIAIALPILMLGCATPQLLLHNPGTLVLKKGDEAVVLNEGVELALRWSVDGKGDSTRVTLRAPAELAKFIAPKGSVALNGTSLTVNEVKGNEFGINFIPHTKQVTTWGDVQEGDRVNLEIDTLARYVARLAEAS